MLICVVLLSLHQNCAVLYNMRPHAIAQSFLLHCNMLSPAFQPFGMQHTHDLQPIHNIFSTKCTTSCVVSSAYKKQALPDTVVAVVSLGASGSMRRPPPTAESRSKK
jgi:hypothetical protein